MQSFLSKIDTAQRNIRNGILVGFVIFGAFALFAQLSSPYDIKVISPQEKMVQRQIEFGKIYENAKPTNEMEEQIMVASKDVYCGMFGVACDDNYETFSDANFDKSLMGKVAGLMSTPYTNPPALGSYYVLNSLQDAGIFPSSYAAEGLGFAGLAPFLHIWKKLRDIAFLIIALAMILSGFMIMFRTRMDPQHAIKLESALPKIIITMILINFSFAIAGFMVDLMYIMTGIIIVTFGPLISPDLSLSTMLDKYVSPGPLDLLSLGVGNYEGGMLGLLEAIWNLIHDLPHALLGMFGEAMRAIIVGISGGILFAVVFSWTWGKLEKFASRWQVPAIPMIIFLIVMILLLEPLIKMFTTLPVIFLGMVIGVTVFWVFAKLLILTFRTYIKLLFYIMLSPLILVGEALPGSRIFVPWIQTIFVELLTFPLMILIFLLSGAFSNAISNGQLLSLPFVASINPEGLGIIVSFGILYTMPELIILVKEKLNKETMSLPALSLGTFFQGVAVPLGGAMSRPKHLTFVSEVLGNRTPVGKLLKNKYVSKWLNISTKSDH